MCKGSLHVWKKRAVMGRLKRVLAFALVLCTVVQSVTEELSEQTTPLYDGTLSVRYCMS